MIPLNPRKSLDDGTSITRLGYRKIISIKPSHISIKLNHNSPNNTYIYPIVEDTYFLTMYDDTDGPVLVVERPAEVNLPIEQNLEVHLVRSFFSFEAIGEGCELEHLCSFPKAYLPGMIHAYIVI